MKTTWGIYYLGGGRGLVSGEKDYSRDYPLENIHKTMEHHHAING